MDNTGAPQAPNRTVFRSLAELQEALIDAGCRTSRPSKGYLRIDPPRRTLAELDSPASGTSHRTTPTRRPQGRAARLSTSTRRRGSRRSSTSPPPSTGDASDPPGSRLPAAVRDRVQAVLDAEARRLLTVAPENVERVPRAA
jgi:hypothetical protein